MIGMIRQKLMERRARKISRRANRVKESLEIEAKEMRVRKLELERDNISNSYRKESKLMKVAKGIKKVAKESKARRLKSGMFSKGANDSIFLPSTDNPFTQTSSDNPFVQKKKRR